MVNQALYYGNTNYEKAENGVLPDPSVTYMQTRLLCYISSLQMAKRQTKVVI